MRRLFASGRGKASRSPVWARHGMVAAAHPLAVACGVEVLKEGGSAVDAAIAVNACLSLMEPTACGLGGDVFALVWDPDSHRILGLNGSGRAPMNLSADKIPPEVDGTIPLHSPYAWTVPGCADGWFRLHERFGRLPMERVLFPAIRYAEEGFPLSPVIARDWGRAAERFHDKPGFCEVFCPGGRAPEEGEVFRNPALAKTLGILARDGRDAFYLGSIGRTLVRYSESHGGFFSREDLALHRSTWDEPISTSYRGWTVWEMPPPGQGLCALQMLNILETFDLAAMGRESSDFWHVMVEAKKLAFADRARYYADPSFYQTPIGTLLSRDYAGERAAAIQRNRASLTDPPGDVPALNRRETTYLCAADQTGLMVSLIQSNYTGFGSGYVIPDLGFGIQNRGALFALGPEHPNRIEPLKRPFHTIIPAMVTQGDDPVLAFGLMGGDMQPQGHAQILVNLVDFGMNLQEAGDAPRFHHTGSSEPTGTAMIGGGILHVEEGVSLNLIGELRRLGHVIDTEPVAAYGGYQAIGRDPETGLFCGATEMRKDGCAAGF